jgi:hypothetical protein
VKYGVEVPLTHFTPVSKPMFMAADALNAPPTDPVALTPIVSTGRTTTGTGPMVNVIVGRGGPLTVADAEHETPELAFRATLPLSPA